MDITEEQEIEIAKAFNRKAKDGIEMIKNFSEKQQLNSEKEIAKFFHKQKDNLNLDQVGDYLGSEENSKVLEAFTKEVNFKGKSFLGGMREFLDDFKLPGEAQKISRLMESFGSEYVNQNPDGDLKQYSAPTLAFSVMMLNTNLLIHR